MKVGWIILIAIVFIFGSWMGAIFEKITLADQEMTVSGNVTTTMAVLDQFGSYRETTTYDIGPWEFPSPNIGVFGTVLKMLTWDFAFIRENTITQYVRMFVLTGISIGIAWGMVVLFIQIVRGIIGGG